MIIASSVCLRRVSFSCSSGLAGSLSSSSFRASMPARAYWKPFSREFFLVYFSSTSFLEVLKESTIMEIKSELITHTEKKMNEYRYIWAAR